MTSGYPRTALSGDLGGSNETVVLGPEAVSAGQWKTPGGGSTNISPGGEPVGHGGESYSTHQAAGTDICALPKATGAHPAGVAERSTAGSALAVVGTVVVAKVCELVNTVRATAMTTVTTEHNLFVAMPQEAGTDAFRVRHLHPHQDGALVTQ
jgi:hypothetical protein